MSDRASSDVETIPAISSSRFYLERVISRIGAAMRRPHRLSDIRPFLRPALIGYSSPRLFQLLHRHLFSHIQRFSGGDFNVRFDSGSFPVGLGDWIDRSGKRHADHEVVVKTMA